MARSSRIEFEGALYYVTARGNERKKIFFSKTDYDKFLHYVAEARNKYRIKIHCYVLMSNHYHLVIETPEANISRAMHYINSSYTTYANIKRKRSGHLFDENAFEYFDTDYSQNEERYLMLGYSYRLRVLVVSYCYRKNSSEIRIISSRKATKKEHKIYFGERK